MKYLSSFVDWRYTAVFLVIAAVVSLLLTKLSGLGFWMIFVIVAAAILVVGWTATWEDERPGGFTNPKSKKNDK